MNRGETRYFVFAGVLGHQDQTSLLAQKIKQLKKHHVGEVKIELKSNWLRMPGEVEKRYLTKYGISQDCLDSLVDAVYEAILGADIKLLAAIVDKEHMKEEYGAKAYHPPAVAYEAILQRVQNELSGQGKCQVFLDDMTGKNPKGNEHKRNLIIQHGKLRKHGSRLIGPTLALDAINDLKFLSSAKNELIQVADLFAYNVFRQFRDYGEDWEGESGSLRTYKYFSRLAPKLRKDHAGRVQGYGIVKFPMKKRVKWSLSER